MTWAYFSRPGQNPGLKLGDSGGNGGCRRPPFVDPLDADHSFLLAEGTVSGIERIEDSGFFFRHRNPQLMMNLWNGHPLGRAPQYPEVPDPNESLGQDVHGFFGGTSRKVRENLLNWNRL